MSLTLANQFSHSRSPETVRLGDDAIDVQVLLPDGEAVNDAQKILGDPAQVPVPEHQGFDDANTKEEYSASVAETADKAAETLGREAAVGHRVLVTGQLAQYLVDKAAIIAEQPTSESQIAAIKFTARHEAAQAPTEESDPFEHLSEAAQHAIRMNRSAQNLDPSELDGVQMTRKAELEAHRRLASAKHVAKLVDKNRRASTDTQPEPIWVDQNGFELGKDEYFRADNFSESATVLKALDRYLDATGRQDEIQDYYDDTFENQTLLEFKGEKAQDVHNALRMVAEQSVEEAREATKQAFLDYGERYVSDTELESDKKFAKRMLEMRAQGPKVIERVEIAPDDEVVRTGNNHNVKPNLKLIQSPSAEIAKDSLQQQAA